MEIPNRIEYDFLLVLLGLVVIIFPFYITEIYKINLSITAVIVYVGILLFLYGFSLMKYEYELNLELKELNFCKEKNESLKYFIDEKLVTKKKIQIMIKEIKETIDQT